MEQAQEKKPGKNMLWGGRFTGSFTLEKLYGGGDESLLMREMRGGI